MAETLPKKNMDAVESLLNTIESLRAPNGCPWDKEQTHESLKKYLIEEAYEVLDAIDHGTPADILEELGDVLFQVCIHAQIEKELGNFDFIEIADKLNRKMISRHPHVFGDVATIENSRDVVAQWEKIKATEKPHRESPFDGIPKDLPALMKAVKVLKKAEKNKLQAPENKNQLPEDLLSSIQDEDSLGELLLSVAEHSKKLKIDPEDALRKAIAKIQRYYEAQLQK
jgi:MazG family protein